MLNALFGPLCRLCERRSHSLRPLGSVKATHPGPFELTEYRLMHCPRCEVVYLDPLPSVQDLKTLYEQSVQFSDSIYTDPERVEKILEYCEHSIRNFSLLPASGGSVLEIGAGLAWVSRVCKRLQPDLRTVAQDLSSECLDICPWVDKYFVGPLENLPERGPYDLISLTHVIEHVPDPRVTLRTIANLLAPNGKVFITAPFRPNGWQPKNGIALWHEYSYLHVPAHISYLSKLWFENSASMVGLALSHWDENQDGGQAFEVVLKKL
jgi:SAM-dependent methyltransferase